MVKEIKLRVQVWCKIEQWHTHTHKHISDLEKGDGECQVGPKLSSRMIHWKVKSGKQRWRMSDGRKSGVFCSPLGSCTLSSCWNLPNYRIYSGRHLDIHTRAFRMTSADVKTCLTRLKGRWGSLSCNNTSGMEGFIVRAQGITSARRPIFRLLGLFSSILLLMLTRELRRAAPTQDLGPERRDETSARSSVRPAGSGPHLQDVSQVSRADLRVFGGVERHGGNPDEAQDARLGVPPQHHPGAVVRLGVKHHLMRSWQFLGSCKTEDLPVRCKYLDLKLSGIKMWDFSCASQEDIN